jgi:hypothetical protein
MISSRIAYGATLEQKNRSCAKHDPAIAAGAFSESRPRGQIPRPGMVRIGGPSILSRLFNSFVSGFA